MYLVIDTATKDLGVALLDEETVAGRFHWRTRQNHTAELIPAVRHLLEKSGLSLQELEGFIVSLGPGGFSGLRVGMTTAKGLAVSVGKPIVAVGTLDASAHPYTGLGASVCALMPVGRGEVAAALYTTNEHGLSKAQEERLTTVEALAQTVSEPTIFCGPITPEIESELVERLGEKALVPRGVGRESRVVSMGAIGIERISRGDADDTVTLQPLYLRRPSISKPKRPPGG